MSMLQAFVAMCGFKAKALYEETINKVNAHDIDRLLRAYTNKDDEEFTLICKELTITEEGARMILGQYPITISS